MSATVLDGKALAARIRGELKLETARLAADGITPGLAVVLVGDDPASQIYVRSKTGACARPASGRSTTGCRRRRRRRAAGLVAALNTDPGVDGILIQLPLPAGIDARRVLFAVDPRKDVDGIHPENVGRLLMGEPRFVACTPFGVMKLIEEARLPLAGAQRRGRRSFEHGRQADGGVAARRRRDRDGLPFQDARSRGDGRARRSAGGRGRPAAEMIRGDWIKPGAVVIDVGINRTAEGKLLGDVEYAARRRARRRDHAGPGRRRPDDDRDAAREHGDRREAAGRRPP